MLSGQTFDQVTFSSLSWCSAVLVMRRLRSYWKGPCIEIPFLLSMSPKVHELVLDNPCKVGWSAVSRGWLLFSVLVSECAFCSFCSSSSSVFFLSADLLHTQTHTMPQPLVCLQTLLLIKTTPKFMVLNA